VKKYPPKNKTNMKFGHTICKNAGKENKSSHILKSQLSFNYNSNFYKNGKNGQK